MTVFGSIPRGFYQLKIYAEPLYVRIFLVLHSAQWQIYSVIG